jgi:D-tagatose-1,6-bisphosphate aldolase subunit GatZ/KbaZ
MIEDPKYWEKYYPGNALEQAYKRKYSFSDRSRYYWPNPRIAAAKRQLVENLKAHPIPLSLLSQYMPGQYHAVSEGLICNDVEEIIIHRTQDVIGIYSRACNPA